MTIASGSGLPPRVTRPSTRKPCSKTISAAASAWPGAIVTVAEAEREPLRKSPAFARRVRTPSGTPASSNVPPAAVRAVAQKSWPCALTVTPASRFSASPVTTPRTSAPSARVSWTSCASSPVTTASAGALDWSRREAPRV